MPRVIVTEPVHEDALALLRAAGWTVEGPGAALTPAEALLVRTQAVPPEAVAGFKMISKHGTGVDNIPLEAAKAAGVTVMNTPGANAAAVAEQTLMLMLAMARDLTGQLAGTRQGVTGLEGRRLLVVGFGETGRRVVQAAMMLGLQVTVLTPRPDQVVPSGARAAQDLQSALRQTDILSLHCPLTPLTQGMIGAAELALLPPGALVVNVARGGLIDEAALADALHSGHLGGAALDVTQQEPLPADDPLRRAPRLILTPHAAGLGQGAFRRMGLQAAQNILDHAAGRPRADCTVAGGA
jgi:D-3-phosphoglycerate dehydrogenase / 2-oxoglutarate reductase